MILNRFQKQTGGNSIQLYTCNDNFAKKYYHRLILSSRSAASALYISDADPGTPRSKVFENNVGPNSFIPETPSRIQAILRNPQTAAFGFASDFLASEEYLNCKVLLHLILLIDF